jgi:hypothetical protein
MFAVHIRLLLIRINCIRLEHKIVLGNITRITLLKDLNTEIRDDFRNHHPADRLVLPTVTPFFFARGSRNTLISHKPIPGGRSAQSNLLGCAT